MNIADIAARAMRLAVETPPAASPYRSIIITHPTARLAFLPTTDQPGDTPPEALASSPRLADAVRRRIPLLISPSAVEPLRAVYGTPAFPYEYVGNEMDRNHLDEKWSDVLASSPKVFDKIE